MEEPHLAYHQWWPEWVRYIIQQITELRTLMTEFASDQAHLDADVALLTAAWTTEATALLAAVAAEAPTAPISSIDFSGLEAQLAAETPVVAPVDPSVPVVAPVDPSVPVVAPVDPTVAVAA